MLMGQDFEDPCNTDVKLNDITESSYL